MSRISDISISISSGLTPLKSNDEYWNSNDIPWLKTEQLGQYKIYDTNEFISKKAFNDTSLKLYPVNTISVAMYGEGKTRGNVSILMNEMTTNQACCNIIVDKEKANHLYVYYWLKNSYLKLRALAAGVRKNLNSEDIKNFEIDIKDRETQDNIASVLSVIDDKISNNNRINAELESMAKTIYDYWFTQFDFPDENGKPYRASGGAMVWNEQLKRNIPAGWTVDNLYAVADYINGLACQNYRPDDDEHKLPVIKITEMHNGITDSTEFVRDDIPEKYIIENGDILFSWSATLETMLWYGGRGGLNQHIFKVVPKAPKYFAYSQLSSYIINFKAIAEARKTTMGHITTDHMEQSRIAIPPTIVQDAFNRQVTPLYEQFANNCKESLRLQALRNWLLPMLMNGQATISD